MVVVGPKLFPVAKPAKGLGVVSFCFSACKARNDMVEFKTINSIAPNTTISFPLSLLPISEHFLFTAFAKLASKCVVAGWAAKRPSISNLNSVGSY